ncbi:hypothetical protein D0T25_22015 [Duganella sp. BJB488]|uniref:hypothetical protein n=1 Tax=unclassified Duganella TaxID=2636909 RepID=UPI000E34DBC7|nr:MULTISPECIES: hypothetical protein [unclassified Duganella]RFP14157.1 hypothetical protein D0T26_22570 [Duganella sp. BJB489]RFP17261.1 hypothetical protein D0T25_22015 [Duganella sp. BJB488]RFP31950.1 hypothetical protein D0T24_23905 [Duganella sp. BJB480]
MNFSLFKSLRAATLLILAAGAAQMACAAPLDIVIGALADYKTFRLKSAELDSLVAPYCTRVRDKARKPMIVREYTCSPESGITAISMDSREGLGEPLPNYMMSIVVDFPADRFPAMKALVVKKLGVPKKGGSDHLALRYSLDKSLNQNGNPVINLSREDAESASLQIALEQGP